MEDQFSLRSQSHKCSMLQMQHKGNSNQLGLEHPVPAVLGHLPSNTCCYLGDLAQTQMKPLHCYLQYMSCSTFVERLRCADVCHHFPPDSFFGVLPWLAAVHCLRFKQEQFRKFKLPLRFVKTLNRTSAPPETVERQDPNSLTSGENTGRTARMPERLKTAY